MTLFFKVTRRLGHDLGEGSGTVYTVDSGAARADGIVWHTHAAFQLQRDARNFASAKVRLGNGRRAWHSHLDPTPTA